MNSSSRFPYEWSSSLQNEFLVEQWGTTTITTTISFLQSTEWNALFFAAKDGNWDLTKLLIQNGANVWLKDKVCCNTLTTVKQKAYSEWSMRP